LLDRAIHTEAGEIVTEQVAKLRSSWIWLLGIYTFASFVEANFYGQLGAFTPLYLPLIGVQPGQVARWTGIITSTAGVLGLPFLPFWGALADRFARKPVIIRSFIAEFLAGTFLIFAGNIWIFLLGRSVTSLSLGNTGLMMTTLSERTPSNRQGLAFSIMNIASPAGAALGPLIGGPVVDHWGFRALLGIDVTLLISVVLLLSLGYNDLFRGTETKPILHMAVDSLRILWQSLRLRTLFPGLFLLFAGWLMASTFTPIAIGQLYRGPNLATMVGTIMGTAGFVALVISPILGTVADRIGIWRVLLAGALLEVLMWPLLSIVPNLTAFAVLWALIIGLASGVFSLSFIILARSAPEKVRGRVMSFSFLPFNIGIIVGPALGSLITRNSIFAIYPAAAVFTLLGIFMLVLASRQPVKDYA
jgi:DHA1 family multidrug resistance protein-like MFS transporter